MTDGLRPSDYITFRDAAGAILERHGGGDALSVFGIDEILQDAGKDADLTPVYAFLEAQGYHCAVTPALGRLAAAALLECPGLLAVRDTVVLGCPLSTGDVAAVLGASTDTPIAIDRAGVGVVLLERSVNVKRHNLSRDRDDYLTVIDVNDSTGTVVVPDGPMRLLRPLVLGRLRLGAAAELLGLADRILDDAVGHARVRQQFGRPIGGFQSMQHLLAWAATERHQLRCLFDIAVGRAAAGPLDPDLSSAVKAMAGQILHVIVQTATQVTGAISFTWEYSLNRSHRRGMALDQIAGSSADLIVALGRQLRTQGFSPHLVELADAVV
ncbi:MULTISPECIES: acyl-CoA dehydrogenase family protein [unclassified Mycobacterium]|uniref:acyl-CoA dehydrogenase family protein n=1 Tax=unclassified Mycobacterium TaxID=2642494 RepID=UPI0029C6F5FE|nr:MULTISPECIES: acyl-CoA dehydrogenase family protein [unclassified Mycobacterium]